MKSIIFCVLVGLGLCSGSAKSGQPELDVYRVFLDASDKDFTKDPESLQDGKYVYIIEAHRYPQGTTLSRKSTAPFEVLKERGAETVEGLVSAFLNLGKSPADAEHLVKNLYSEDSLQAITGVLSNPESGRRFLEGIMSIEATSLLILYRLSDQDFVLITSTQKAASLGGESILPFRLRRETNKYVFVAGDLSPTTRYKNLLTAFIKLGNGVQMEKIE